MTGQPLPTISQRLMNDGQLEGAPRPMREFLSDSLAVHVHADAAALAADAAQSARAFLVEAIRRQGRAASILATGNSQVHFLETLGGLSGVD